MKLAQEKLFKYLMGSKINQVLSIMLTSYKDELVKEVRDLIKEEIRQILSGRV